MAMRWKKYPAPTGLAKVAARPRGSELRINSRVRVATVQAHGHFSGKTGWFWVAGWGHPGIPYKNTCSEPSQTEAEAKAAALAYVQKCLKQPPNSKD